VSSPDNPISLERELRDRVLGRLGLASPPSPDLRGLRALYGAWCANVPFDNICKMMALRIGGGLPLPGQNAVEFFETWLTHGAGGTCWPTSNALFELTLSLGFESHRIAGFMRDLGIINHASVRVNIGGGRWLVDSSMLTNVPLPLNQELFVHGDPVFAVEVEPAGATHVIWWDAPPNPAYLPCRLLADPVDHAYYLAAYEGSRDRSPFNQRLYARRNRPGELLVLLGHTRFSKTAGGLQARDLSPDEVSRVLHGDVGISQDLIEQWVRAGGLKAAFEAPVGPPPPPIVQMPPSKR
jgi:N-hydroxyarylamine O-acetyltransferase